ncbi:MAG: response regulator [Candidatus Micrarchaeia archaeon]
MAKKTSILIIDDEADIRASIIGLLKSKGYENLDSASTPETGIKKAKKGGYDLIILDMIMPRISGWGVLKELRKAKIETRVLVVSAVGLPEMVGTDLKVKYPAVKFLGKSSLVTDLEKKVAETLAMPAAQI